MLLYPEWSSVFILLLLLVIGFSCQSPEQSLDAEVPAGFLEMVIPADNPTTTAGVELGRRLFFDPILSRDQTISCATCHQTALAFTDTKAKSIGIDGRIGTRSAPSLLNIGFHYQGVFWDGRSASLEEQAIHPIQDSLEMDAYWPTIAERLRMDDTYLSQFQSAFGAEAISLENTAKALAQYQRTLISADSHYDRVIAQQADFTPAQARGYAIFFDTGSPELPMAECSHCHVEPLFTDLKFANNGLDTSLTLLDFPDLGRGAITGNKYDNGTFRIPTLRNIEITAPYMHDGRFQTLEEVVAHYNMGGHYAENVDPNVRKLNLSTENQQDLIAFLQTLTDSTALVNPLYQAPQSYE